MEQKRRNRVRYLAEWIDGRMHDKGLTQEDVAKELNISQEAFSTRLNPKTYEKNKKADPFKFGDLLIIFIVLGATPDEMQRLFTL